MENNGGFVVACRFRPLNDREKQKSQELLTQHISADKKTIKLANPSKPEGLKEYTFDYIFSSDSTQEEIYSTIAEPIIKDIFKGFNGIILAFGQTSSGKTFTMYGSEIHNNQSKGIIPRMIFEIFETIEASDSVLYTINVSYCEIYLGKVYDLLSTNRKELIIREDPIKGAYIQGITEKYASTYNELFGIMEQGKERRKVGSTLMNTISSRSHSLFMCNISQETSKNTPVKTSTLFLVDLAGHEDIKKNNSQGEVIKEAKDINLSLLALGRIIRSLSKKDKHIPYKESTLTRILQKSLAGNSKVALIVTCSPSFLHYNETIITLEFGVSSKLIKISPKINTTYNLEDLKKLVKATEDALNLKQKELNELTRKYEKDVLLSHNNGNCESLKQLEELRKSYHILENEKEN